MRRPPLRGRLASAHDIGREWQVLEALHDGPGEVPVPTPVAQCTDEDVTGAPFYAMAFVDGTILRTAADGAALTPEVARRATESLVDTHAALHSLDPETVGLGDLGPRVGYVARQLERWRGQYERARVRELPTLVAVHDSLAAAIPPDAGPAVVHGDYRFDNVVLAPNGSVERSSTGSCARSVTRSPTPCWSFMYWADPGDTFFFLPDPPTLAAAFPSRGEIAERYSAVSGRHSSTSLSTRRSGGGRWPASSRVCTPAGSRGAAGAGPPRLSPPWPARTDELLELASTATARIN